MCILNTQKCTNVYVYYIIKCHLLVLVGDLFFLFFRLYVDPMLSTDGASAGDKAIAVTPTTADGLELWISVCNTLGSACNNPQNGMFVYWVCVCACVCMM